MYDEKTIKALDQGNFDFTTFDWKAAKAYIKWHAPAARLYKLSLKEDGDGEWPELPEGIPACHDIRALHVAYGLARGRPIVGERGIEHVNTGKRGGSLMAPYRVKRALACYPLEVVEEEVVEAEAVAA